MVLIGFGLGMIGGPLADMSLAKVPHEDAGSASGLFNTVMHLGIALGTALTALVFFRHHRRLTRRRPQPRRVPHRAVVGRRPPRPDVDPMFCLPKQANISAD